MCIFVSQKCPEYLILLGKKNNCNGKIKITLFFKNKISEEVATGNEETERCKSKSGFQHKYKHQKSLFITKCCSCSELPNSLRSEGPRGQSLPRDLTFIMDASWCLSLL